MKQVLEIKNISGTYLFKGRAKNNRFKGSPVKVVGLSINYS